MPMPMGYEQFQPPSSNLNANNSKKIKIENDHSQQTDSLSRSTVTHEI
jgi:hypothetical protein